MENDPIYGSFWKIIYDEYCLSKRLLLKLTGFTTLMEDQPAGKKSIELREKIVLPLLTIQQYGLMKIQELIQRENKINPYLMFMKNWSPDHFWEYQRQSKFSLRRVVGKRLVDYLLRYFNIPLRFSYGL